MKRLLCVVLVLLVLVVPPAGAAPVAAPDMPLATTLTAGDIAIIGINTDDADQFAFVLLTNVTVGTQINFTDNGWLSIGAFRSGEGTTTWTAPSDLCAGTVVNPAVGTMAFSASGDQILAYQGTTASPTFVYALNDEGAGAWQTTATDSNTSALPTGLTNGTTAVALNEIDNAIYSGTTSGTRAALLASISNNANWTGSDAVRQTMPPGPFTITDAPPCGDIPPTVSSTVPTSGATGISPNTTITLNFSEQVDVATGAFTVECPVGTFLTFSSSPVLPASDTTSVVLTPSSALPSSTTCRVTAIASLITDNGIPPNELDGDGNGAGGDNYVFAFTTTSGGVTKIHAIQGSGSAATPGTFTVEAIVTGDYQGVTGVDDFKLDGFFIQEEDADVDGNPATSEGIFVFCQTCPTNVVVGDKVQVTGSSSEYFSMSQLNATTAGSVVVVSGGNPLPTPAAITLPVPGVTATDLAGAQTQINAYYEPFEGMLVQMAAQLSVTEYFELFRYGQVVLAQGGRFRQFTDANAPSTAGYTAHQIDLARRKVILDDDSNQQNHALAENPDIPIFHPVPGFSTTNYLRGGDAITNLTGVLHWSFAGQTGTDAWRIRPVTSAFSYAFTPGNPRTSTPAAVGGNLRVGSFNTLNFFTTIDTTSSDTTGPCAPSGTQDCRGADSAVELTQQRTKLVAAICALDADVLGLMELENPNPSNDPEAGDGIGDYVLKDLVGALNAPGSACPDKTYAFTDGTAAGTDAIRVGIIYKTSSVTPIGTPVALTAAGYTDPNGTGSQKSRPALAQTFEDNAWGERFTIVANHLKSKGCSTSPALDTDQSDGQGCWNDTRQKGATYLVNTWLPTDPTGSGDPDFLIVGDMNAYRKEAPITNITAAGYADLIASKVGASAYGYLFDGQLGYLDHALSSAALTPQVTGATEWHINADEVNLLDYNDTVQDAAEQTLDAKPTATNLYEPNAYRSTDHDPVLVGLGLYPDQSDLAAYGLAWHTGQGTWRLGATWTGDASSSPDTNDGVTRNSADNWNDGQGEVRVTVNGPADKWACLNAWLDYSDGTVVAGTPDTPNNAFDGNEHVVNNLPIQAGVYQLVSWPLEPGVIDGAEQYNMRFRLVPAPNPDVADCSGVTLAAAAAALAPDGGASPTGRADGGEVEDYTWTGNTTAVTLNSFAAAGVPGAGWPTAAGLGALGVILLAWRRRK